MGNILVEQLPDAVQIGEEVYPIRTDFRSCLRVIMAFEDEQLTLTEKIAILLANLYPKQPPDTAGAVLQGLRFLNAGEEEKEDEAPRARRYSFEKDAQLIFAGFRQTNGIDLETADLHWWKFMALFMDIGADTAFCNLVAMRDRLCRGTASKEERAFAAKHPDTYYLGGYHTPEELGNANEFWQALAEGEQKREGA